MYPDLHILTRGLTSVFRNNGYTDGQVTVIDRKPSIRATTFPTEVVTCQVDDGSELRLWCKYSAGHSHNVWGHRGGVAYEAEVYRNVLWPSQASVPRFYGAHTDMTTGETWIILEYLDESVHAHKALDPAAMGLAARWIGRFHAANEARLSSGLMPSLQTYDAAYYRGWARRTSQFAGHLHQRFPWLATLCERFEGSAASLLAAPPTIIHGEYYPKNVLYYDGNVYPIDWESAAMATGEIDLAFLTDRWPAEITRQREREYKQARWPHGAPAAFEQRLAAAQLYMHFRWLGDRPEWTTHKHYWRFEHLCSVGEQLGLIQCNGSVQMGGLSLCPPHFPISRTSHKP